MMENIKLLIFDLDGTLTLEKRVIPKKLQNTLRQLQRDGYLVTTATGNAFVQFMWKYAAQFLPNAPMVLENGARIGDIYESYQQSVPLGNDILAAIPEIITRNETDFIGFYPGTEEDYVFYTPSLPLNPSLDPITQTTVTDIDQYQELSHTWNPSRMVIGVHNETLWLPEGFTGTVASNMGSHEITPANTDKGWGVRTLLESLGLTFDQVAVFGNGYNDIALFQTDAVMKVYVGEECPELEQYATHRVSDAVDLEKFLSVNLN